MSLGIGIKHLWLLKFSLFGTLLGLAYPKVFRTKVYLQALHGAGFAGMPFDMPDVSPARTAAAYFAKILPGVL